ncbi:MAG: ATP-sensitive inward rectifier potassium channel 10 [Deltaproteobacteria bacterium]|nr:ATP-sensitive inward rectifier potassium channel 10 [Deltaproteobacteria bacterium]
MPNTRTNVSDDLVVVGAVPHPLRDAYHSLLRMRWPSVLAIIAGGTFTLNATFACLYLLVGGIANAQPGSFKDAFFFSVQTMGTIGYGAMYPTTLAANILVAFESVASIIITALATGIVFARFSQSSGRIVFASKVCITPMNGRPTLTFRLGNERASTIYEATVRVVAITTERTDEGVTFYRMHDLVLVRDRSPALQRSFNVMHVIDEKSPLFRMSPDRCRERELEIHVSVVGTDDTSLQPVHARARYLPDDIAFGARPADILSELPDGKIQLDVRKFDDVVPTKPTDDFPYPSAST